MNNALEYVKMMVESGLEKPAAEQIVKVIHNVMTSNFATKHDLEKMELKASAEFDKLRSEMNERFVKVESEIQSIRSEIKSSFENLELKMTVKLGLMLVTSIGVMTTLNKLL